MMSAAARNLRAMGADVSFVHLAQAAGRRGHPETFLWEGSECFALGYRRTPNTFTNYVLPSREAARVARDFDSLFLLGVGQAGVLLWPDERPYRAWLATTVQDEYRARSWRSEIADRHWGWILNRATLPLTRAFEQSAVTRASELFALSRSTQQMLQADYRAESIVLPFPVDLHRFQPGIFSPTSVVIYVGRVDDNRKNVPLLVRAFADVINRVPNAELWLVGSYSPTGPVARAVESSGLGNNVKFLGYQPDEALPDLYRQAAVFALPSRQEGLGIVVLEAMACGLPVVSTRCGGPEEDVEDSRAGALVPVEDSEAFAEELCVVLQSSAKRFELRERALAFVRRAHSDEAFQQVLHPGSTSGAHASG